jgi:hypothetical protein
MTLLLRRARLIAALAVLVDPGADHDLQAEFGGDRRNQFDAAGRRVQADRAGHRRQLLQVGANLFGLRDIVDVRMRVAVERRIGDARQHAAEVRSLLFLLEKTPERGMHSGDKQQNGDDSAHRG